MSDNPAQKSDFHQLKEEQHKAETEFQTATKIAPGDLRKSTMDAPKHIRCFAMELVRVVTAGMCKIRPLDLFRRRHFWNAENFVKIHCVLHACKKALEVRYGVRLTAG